LQSIYVIVKTRMCEMVVMWNYRPSRHTLRSGGELQLQLKCITWAINITAAFWQGRRRIRVLLLVVVLLLQFRLQNNNKNKGVERIFVSIKNRICTEKQQQQKSPSSWAWRLEQKKTTKQQRATDDVVPHKKSLFSIPPRCHNSEGDYHWSRIWRMSHVIICLAFVY